MRYLQSVTAAPIIRHPSGIAETGKWRRAGLQAEEEGCGLQVRGGVQEELHRTTHTAAPTSSGAVATSQPRSRLPVCCSSQASRASSSCPCSWPRIRPMGAFADPTPPDLTSSLYACIHAISPWLPDVRSRMAQSWFHAGARIRRFPSLLLYAVSRLCAFACRFVGIYVVSGVVSQVASVFH